MQAYADLKGITEDFKEAKFAAGFLGITDFGPEEAYILNKDLLDSKKSITYAQTK